MVQSVLTVNVRASRIPIERSDEAYANNFPSALHPGTSIIRLEPLFALPTHLTCNTVTGRLPTSLRATTSHFPNSCSACPLDFGSSPSLDVAVSPGAGEGFGRTRTRLHANDFSGTDGVRFWERFLGRGRVLRMQCSVTGGWSSGVEKGFVRANRAERKTTGLMSRLGGRIVCRNVSVGGLLDVSFSSNDWGRETEYRSIPFGVVIANYLTALA